MSESDVDNDLDVGQEIAKFPNAINIAQLYHLFYNNLSVLFRTTTPNRAIEYFYNMLPPFLILEDEEFRVQYLKIQEKYKNNIITMYQLHHTELIRLLTRAGIIPRPDVILKLYSEDAPKSVDELTQEEVTQ